VTELSFLLSLLLDHKLPKAVQGLIKDRIKEIQLTPQQPIRINPMIRDPHAQAPSTQALLDQAPIMTPAAIKRIVGGEISTGGSASGLSGTKGPRKF
jgi:hypothetical protein